FERHSQIAASATSEPGHTRHAPTARPNASSRHPCANGSTPDPSRARPSEPKLCRHGCAITTPADLMPPSAASLPSQNSRTTSLETTSRSILDLTDYVLYQ